MKERHVKTFQEKYGICDLTADVQNTLCINAKDDALDLFDKLPYVGYLRIPASFEFGDWWYDTNDDIVKTKIVKVTEDGIVEHVHYDSHHRQLAYMRTDSNGFLVKGNCLIRKNSVDNLID